MRCFLEKLHMWNFFYTTTGRDGRDKYQVWPLSIHYNSICHFSYPSFAKHFCYDVVLLIPQLWSSVEGEL